MNSPISGGKQLRVLLIEDNRDFAEVFSILLQQKGCEAIWEENAAAGLENAKQGSYDVIFCDIGLPGSMDGFQFARSVRSEGHMCDTCLVSISGYNDKANREEAVNAGYDYVLTKPVDFGDLDEILRQAFRRLQF